MTARGTPAPFELDGGGEHLERIADDRDRALGRYRLSYQIASGGMATVFLGRVLGPGGFNRAVAIKRIHPHLASRREFVAMFLDEARIAARIAHPNVCSVFDFGEVDGSYFMAMEYLVGVSLTRLIAAVGRRPDALASVRWRALSARIIADAAEGLHAAHELSDEDGRPLGVVHRDVSPQNLFITFDGAVKVVDFGIALARDRMQETNTGTLKGKFGYMAPEHASGEAIDRRADVWGLGVVLWEMLTAERLFKRRNDMETILAIRSGQIPRPSERIDGIPPELDAIVMKALSVDARARYPTARALGRDLGDLVRSQPAPAGLADLAELMESIFSEEKSEKIDVVKTVLAEAERDGIDALPTLPTALPGTPRFGSDTASMPSPDGTRSGVLVRDTRVTATRARRGWLLAAAAALGCAVIGAGFGLASTGSEGTGRREDAKRSSEKEPSASSEVPVLPEASREPEVVRVEPGRAPVGAGAESAKRARPPRERRVRAERSAPRAAEERATGHAHVVTVGGWGDVYVGRRRVGRTPLRVELPSGRRTLTIRPFGDGAPQRVSVDVPPGDVVPVVVHVAPQ